MKDQRGRYYENLARSLYDNPGSLTEADLDYKRGYWKGIQRLLNQPFFDQQAVERDMRREVEPSE